MHSPCQTLSSLKIVIAAGDLSGDQRAASLVNGIQKISRDSVTVRGMGGEKLEALGVELVVDSRKYGGVMGFTELLYKSKEIVYSFRTMKKLLLEWKPSLFIAVDYPDFNLRLCAYAKSLGIKVFYFIPPKVWAWRQKRIKLLKRYCDGIGVIFPFEEKFYHERGVKQVSFVGHPFVEESPLWIKSSKESFYKKHNLTICNEYTEATALKKSSCIFALLPGSREKEITQHLSIMIEAVKKFFEEMLQSKTLNSSTAIIVLPEKYRNNQRFLERYDELLQKYGAGKDSLSLFHLDFGNSLEVMAHADYGLLKCGTCNLEASFLNLPFVVLFKTSRMTALIVKKFVRLKEFSIVNIIRPGTAKELLQDNCTVENLVQVMREMFLNRESVERQKRDFLSIQHHLCSYNQKSSSAKADAALQEAGVPLSFAEIAAQYALSILER
jgi:lipid-A-disaccharide synthase